MRLRIASWVRFGGFRGASVGVVVALLVSVGCASSAREAGDLRSPGSLDELRAAFPTDEAIEDFLRTARVSDMKTLDTGVTRSSRMNLTKGDIQIRALWKTIDASSPVKRFTDGTHELRFRDSYKNEIAAYELGKILDLPMIAPAVKRMIARTQGCVQLWMEGTRNLADLLLEGIREPDLDSWKQQRATIHLFHQLIYDTDWKNVANILVDENFDSYIIDSSRAFRLQEELPPESKPLRLFSRDLLARLEALTPEVLEQHLSPWISKQQITALLARRDLIVKMAESEIAARGEEAVLF